MILIRKDGHRIDTRGVSCVLTLLNSRRVLVQLDAVACGSWWSTAGGAPLVEHSWWSWWRTVIDAVCEAESPPQRGGASAVVVVQQ